MERLRQAGCVRVAMGVECGDPRYRRELLGRHMSTATIRRAFETARRAGLKTHGFCMIGLPFETEAQLGATVRLMDELSPDGVTCQVYFPLPGSPLYDLCRARGLLVPPAATDRGHDILNLIRHVNLPTRDLEAACRRFGLLNRAPGPTRGAAARDGAAVGPPAPGPTRLAERFPLDRIRAHLPAGWEPRGFAPSPPYEVLTVERGERRIRIGFAPRGACTAYFARTDQLDIAYLTEGAMDVMADPEAADVFRRVLRLVTGATPARRGPKVAA
jgi:hypothetical protein